MIIPGDKKKTVSIIISRMKPDGGMTQPSEMKAESHLDGHMKALTEIAEEMIAAMDKKSPVDLAHCLKAFLAEHETNEHENGELDEME